MVLVDAKALKTLVLGFLRASTIRGPKPFPSNVEIAHAMELETTLRNHERVTEGPESIQVGDIVEPKPACNTLRAADTAYGQAVVVELDPFLLASEDYKFSWPFMKPENFTVVGRIDDATLHLLTLKWKNK